ncbi:Golgi transport complex subunit 6 [Hypoxylon texense]
MQVLPFFQVSDLPPSASFYAAITQPLGLRYISATPSSIVFGDAASPTPEPVFEVKKSVGANSQPPQPCHLVLSAKSPSAVSAFHAAALRANPDLQDCDANSNFFQPPDSSDSTGESRARIGDFDGNIMEVVHGSRPGYAASQAGSAVQRNSHEVSRVLDWNLDVGTPSVASRSAVGTATPGSVAPSAVGSRAADSAPYSFLQRSVTSSTVETSPRENSKGLNTSAVVGTVLGMAVGAAVGGALTYTMMKNDPYREANAFQQEYEQPPPFSRRSTAPDPYPNNQPRYIEYPPGKYPPSSFTGARSRVVEELDDRSSRHSSHYTTGSRSRGRSEVSSARRPLMITDHEHRSNAGSKHSDAPRMLTEAEHRSNAGSKYTAADHRSHAGSKHPSSASAAPSRHSPESDLRSYVSSKQHAAAARPRDAEVESYVSARSERSDRTVRPSPARVETAPPSRAASQAGSRYSSNTVRPAAAPRAHSHFSAARHVPQPESSVGSSSSSADWEDVCSVAPSDSISNVGSRRSHYA